MKKPVGYRDYFPSPGTVVDKGDRDQLRECAVTYLLGEQVRRLRIARGWTQQEFANQMGMNVSYARLLETGKHMSTQTLVKLANVFDCGLMVTMVPFSEMMSGLSYPQPKFIVPDWKQETADRWGRDRGIHETAGEFHGEHIAVNAPAHTQLTQPQPRRKGAGRPPGVPQTDNRKPAPAPVSDMDLMAEINKIREDAYKQEYSDAVLGTINADDWSVD